MFMKHKQAAEPKTNYHCYLYTLYTDWLFLYNSVTFDKYFCC